MTEKLRPGAVRDAILEALASAEPMSVDAIHSAVQQKIGGDVARSSVRSYLNLNTPDTFHRVGRGIYRLANK